MFFIYLVFAFIIALIVSSLFVVPTRWSRPGRRDEDEGLAGSLPRFFAIVSLATWAFGVWIPPFGPLFFAAPVLSFLFIAVTIGLIIAAVNPERPPQRRMLVQGGAAAMAAEDEATAVGFEILSIPLGTLALMAIGGYWRG